MALGLGVVLMSSAIGSENRYTPIVRAVEGAKASVVNIRGEKTVGLGAEASQTETTRRVNGMGSGVIIDPRGYVVTNLHVVDGVEDIRVTCWGGKQYIARLVARDVQTDLAVIRIMDDEPLPVVNIGTSSDIMVGEPCIAVGNAYGYEHTVTRGIISAIHRPVQVSDAQFYDDLIQTDASINPGNSGGPLLNIDGEMIGVNVAVRAGAQGIGFAIPIDKALAVVADMLGTVNDRLVSHGVTSARTEDAKPSQGLVVEKVESSSPAEASGLHEGDRIIRVANHTVARPLDFQLALLEREPGSEIKMTVQRNDEVLEVSMMLDRADRRSQVVTAASATRPTATPRLHPAWDMLGLELTPMNQETFQSSYHTKHRGGLSVVTVRPGSPAARQGIEVGDVLVGMHHWETISLENVAYILKRTDLAAMNPVKFYILRGEEVLYGYLPVDLRTARRP